MGYSIEDFMYDSDFVDNMKVMVGRLNETGDSGEFVSEFLLDELENITSMETPVDSDHRFKSYRDAFVGLVIRSMIGGRGNELASTGSIMIGVFNALAENGHCLEELISIKYRDENDFIVSYDLDDRPDEL